MEKIWLKSYHNAVPAEINFEKITLSEALTRTAVRFPNNPALLFQGTTISFKKLDDMVSRFASHARRFGGEARRQSGTALAEPGSDGCSNLWSLPRARWWS